MKKLMLAGVALLLMAAHLFAQQQATKAGCNPGVELNPGFSRGAALQSIMNKYAAEGIPGVSLAVYSEEGWWAGASGFARTESKTKMEPCHLQYLQSVAKTFMAVAILRLHEEGRIGLDVPFTKYLDAKYHRLIKNAEKITVRMLLNHTSGIPEYNSHPAYTQYVILNPQKIFVIEKALDIIKHEPPQFEPGSRYRYTNTNYLILAMMTDKVTGDNGKYIREKILQPLQMKNSHYDPKRYKLDYPMLVDSYWDLINESRPTNITPMQKANVAPLMGDDGVVATPVDAIKFMRGLMEGKLLKDSSMKQMQQWVKNDEGKPAYGLGLIHIDLDGIIGYGHGGGGLGAGCMLLYVPSKKIYVFLAVNIGVLIEGPLVRKVDSMKNEILAQVLQ